MKEEIKKYIRKNPLWELVLLLIISFGIISAYSFSGSEFKIPEIKLKKSEISEVFNPRKKKINLLVIKKKLAETDTVLRKVIINTDTVRKGNKTEIKYDTIIRLDTLSKLELMTRLDTSKQRILLIGDSMLEHLRTRLRDYCGENGHEQKTVIWYSSTTKYFGESDTLAYFINDYKPTYIILVLGANELFVRDIKKKRQKYVEHILHQIGNKKFVWVGPPNWKDDTGINEMIIENVGEGRYYPSLNLKYSRYSDGAHPKRASAYRWMDSVAHWINHKSMYPIVMEKPTKRYKQSTNTTMLKPIRN